MIRLILTLAAAVAITACERHKHPADPPPDNKPTDACALTLPSLNVCVQVDWQQGPTDKGASSMQMRFVGPIDDSNPVDPVDAPALPFVKLWMPDMDHGSHVQAKVERIGPGLYQVSNLVFTMDGAWEVRIQLLDGDRVVEETILRVKI